MMLRWTSERTALAVVGDFVVGDGVVGDGVGAL